jgi:hypothetical protein
MHGWQSVETALSTRPYVPAGQLQLVKDTLPAKDTDGGGQRTAAVDPAAQKLPGGQVVLVLLDVHRFPAGQTVLTELPASQNAPAGQEVTLVAPAEHTVPAGHRI